jgi:transcriptional regulator with XRE-family HTH domain
MLDDNLVDENENELEEGNISQKEVRSSPSPRKKTPADEAAAREIARKVNYLLDTYRKPNGERYQHREIAAASNGTINHSWLWKLANAQLHSPGIQALKALTDFFKIDASFWFRDLDEQADKPHKFSAGVQNIMARVTEQDLTPEEQQAMLSLLDNLMAIRKARGTPD